jgi:hypothetical protein
MPSPAEPATPDRARGIRRKEAALAAFLRSIPDPRARAWFAALLTSGERPAPARRKVAAPAPGS